MFDRREFERTCLSCGAVEYMPGFEPLDKIDEKGGNREPRHGGSRL